LCRCKSLISGKLIEPSGLAIVLRQPELAARVGQPVIENANGLVISTPTYKSS
jgi:hypothetical protein